MKMPKTGHVRNLGVNQKTHELIKIQRNRRTFPEEIGSHFPKKLNEFLKKLPVYDFLYDFICFHVILYEFYLILYGLYMILFVCHMIPYDF